MTRFTFIISESSLIAATGLATILTKEPGFQVVRLVSNARETALALARNKPNFLILNPDICKTEKSFNLVLSKLGSARAIAFTTNYEHKKSVLDSFDARIDFFDDDNQIIEIVNSVLRKKFEQKNYEPEKASELSEREVSVLKLIATGLTNKEVGEKLFISEHTAIVHRKHITQKLGIKSVSGLTVYAIINKLIRLEDGLPLK